jgi:hypothetical protein
MRCYALCEQEEMMRRLFVTVLLLVVTLASVWAQRPFYSIRAIQEVSAESLAVADGITNFSANSSQLRWKLQTSPHLGDTLTTVGIVVVPPGVITYTSDIWTMLLYDTTSGLNQWAGILLRGNLADSTKLKQDGFLNVAPGDIITLTGVVSEFPTNRGFSATQLAPLAGNPITIIGSAPIPEPVVRQVGDFYTGIFSTGKVQYSTGEPYEGMYVELHNLTIDNKVNQDRGTFSAVDDDGNEISEYDWTHYFTLGHGTTSLPLWPADSAWSARYAILGPGVRIDTLRGVMTSASGAEGPRGYRIAPIYPSDIVFNPNPAPPLVTSHRRYPVVVTPDSTATITVKVTKQTFGAAAKTISLLYSIDNAAYQTVAMTFVPPDSAYAVIPQQTANTTVRYFIEVVDSIDQVVRLANSAATSSIARDSSKGVFFYTSLARPLTIQDVQYTPFVNGRTPYLGAALTLSGIVTADTVHISLSPATSGSTNAWYMQSTNQPWSGIWLTTTDTTVQRQMAELRNGDSISVSGTVQEQFDVTRLGSITAVTKISSGNAVPAPVVRSAASLNVSNGNPLAEPYEGMLVRLDNLTVTDLNPTFSDVTEFSVSDGTGAAVVQRSGRYSYSNLPADTLTGKIILHEGNGIASLTGIVYYSFNQYKFVPRTDADFVGVVFTGVAERTGAGIPGAFELSQNYPNPFNPSTTIRYAIPATGMTTLKIFNILGQEVATLVNEVQTAGVYAVRFDASSLASGLYFFRIQSGSFSQVKKMVLVK